MALGAQRGDLMGMIIRQGLLLTCAGALLGLIGSLIVSRLFRELLFGMGPADPVSYGLALFVLGAAASSRAGYRRGVRHNRIR